MIIRSPTMTYWAMCNTLSPFMHSLASVAGVFLSFLNLEDLYELVASFRTDLDYG
jgi:hypothetical protein